MLRNKVLKKFLAGVQKYRGGVKAKLTVSKKKQILFIDGFPKGWVCFTSCAVLTVAIYCASLISHKARHMSETSWVLIMCTELEQCSKVLLHNPQEKTAGKTCSHKWLA